MSVYIRYPNGFVGAASEAVARVLLRQPGHIQVREMPAYQESKVEIDVPLKKEADDERA